MTNSSDIFRRLLDHGAELSTDRFPFGEYRSKYGLTCKATILHKVAVRGTCEVRRDNSPFSDLQHRCVPGRVQLGMPQLGMPQRLPPIVIGPATDKVLSPPGCHHASRRIPSLPVVSIALKQGPQERVGGLAWVGSHPSDGKLDLVISNRREDRLKDRNIEDISEIQSHHPARIASQQSHEVLGAPRGPPSMPQIRQHEHARVPP
eukprot:scaffold2743_cov186-Pinguiococcus_pyrenoidosus.AAC.1